MNRFEVGAEPADPALHQDDRHLVRVDTAEDEGLQLAVGVRPAVRVLVGEEQDADVLLPVLCPAPHAIASLVPPLRLVVVLALPALEPRQVGALLRVVEAREVALAVTQDVEVGGAVLAIDLDELREQLRFDPRVDGLEQGW